MPDDTEQPQFTSLKDRIAALSQQKNFNSPPGQPKKHAPAPPIPSRTASATADVGTVTQPVNPNIPPRPAAKVYKAAPPPLPRRSTEGVGQGEQGGISKGVPPVPTIRSKSSQSRRQPPPPPIPTRDSSSRRASGNQSSSGASQASSESKKLPPTLDQANLPFVPPTRRELEARARQEDAQEAEQVKPLITPPVVESAAGSCASGPRHAPKLPPRLPPRNPAEGQASSKATGKPSVLGVAQPNGLNGKTTKQNSEHTRPKLIGFRSGRSQTQLDERLPPIPQRVEDSKPPPIPMATRPSMNQVESYKSRGQTDMTALNCWTCRDWSQPDSVAAQFPRNSLPRDDLVGYLAHGLCAGFPSFADKARAIFTWFHHNISYDTVSFFGNSIKHQTAEDTIACGMAVCSGYAETYKSIANRAGLECVIVEGHGKGFGHTPLNKGERPPPPSLGNHAWNAVRVDGGEWRLIDACWGAGQICPDNNLFKKRFSPVHFTRSNDQFGQLHFPKESQYQMRSDGRVVDWEEYYMGSSDGKPPIFYTNGHDEGISESSIAPASGRISVYGGDIVRFQFSKICEHWRSEKHGLGDAPLLFLKINGAGGGKDDMVPIETNGYWHWVDVRAEDLGAPGQSVQVAQLTSFDGGNARGISVDRFKAGKGKVGMAWAYVMKWELV